MTIDLLALLVAEGDEFKRAISLDHRIQVAELAVDFDGKRYDMGDKLGIMQANCEIALKHPEIGDSFREYITELAKTL